VLRVGVRCEFGGYRGSLDGVPPSKRRRAEVCSPPQKGVGIKRAWEWCEMARVLGIAIRVCRQCVY